MISFNILNSYQTGCLSAPKICVKRLNSSTQVGCQKAPLNHHGIMACALWVWQGHQDGDDKACLVKCTQSVWSIICVVGWINQDTFIYAGLVDGQVCMKEDRADIVTFVMSLPQCTAAQCRHCQSEWWHGRLHSLSHADPSPAPTACNLKHPSLPPFHTTRSWRLELNNWLQYLVSLLSDCSATL